MEQEPIHRCQFPWIRFAGLSNSARHSSSTVFSGENMSASVRPNVVLFMLDTLRADYCSCYGHAAPTTPEIDRLAAEGAVFLDNVSPAIWTLPSVASMMTGLYPHSHVAGAHNDSFDERHTTIAETLAARG